MADLDLLLADGVIDEVLGGLKSGKEADVWLVRHNGEVLAAKVYKERHARNFKNNVGYKEGRAVRNSRTQRAMDRGSRFGQAAAEEAWKSAEADALYKLHAAGVRVPTPVMFYEGVLLMQLVTDPEGQPAPRLIDALIPREAVKATYEDLCSQVVKMLCGDLIHGDLSPYNVLLGAAGPTIIDFPQIISAAQNSQSEFFFRRDVDNLHSHFRSLDPSLPGHSNAAEIWRAYTRRELTPDFVPTGVQPREERRPQGAGGPSGADRPPQQGPRRGGGAPQQARGGSPPGQRRGGGGKGEGAPQQARGGSAAPPNPKKGPPGNRPRLPEVSYRGQVPPNAPAAPANAPAGAASGDAPVVAAHRRRRRRRR